jgi:hypothetical protein
MQLKTTNVTFLLLIDKNQGFLFKLILLHVKLNI